MSCQTTCCAANNKPPFRRAPPPSRRPNIAQQTISPHSAAPRGALKEGEQEGAGEAATGAGLGAAAQLQEAVEEAEAAARRSKWLNAVALGGVVCVWAIMAFFIFVYGNIIYSLLGKSAEQSFSTTWGISYAMDNASQWQARKPGTPPPPLLASPPPRPEQSK